jgi:hypothetical protein
MSDNSTATSSERGDRTAARGVSAATPQLELMGSRHFPAWLAGHRVSLAFTTYQSGKLFLIGLQPDGRLSVFERTFNRCLGLWSDGQTLWMSSLYQLWRFENALEPGQVANGYDRLYVPKVGYVTGDFDIHDGGKPRAIAFEPQPGVPRPAQGKRPTGVPPWVEERQETSSPEGAESGMELPVNHNRSAALSGLPAGCQPTNPGRRSRWSLALGWMNDVPLGLKT